MIVGSRQ